MSQKKQRNKKYNPNKSFSIHRLKKSDLLDFFGSIIVFLNMVKQNQFKIDLNEFNQLQLKKIYIVTYIYVESILNDKTDILNSINYLRSLIDSFFAYMTSDLFKENPYIFIENKDYDLIGDLVARCHMSGVGKFRKDWAYQVSCGVDKMFLALKISDKPINKFIKIDQMREFLFNNFEKQGLIVLE